MNRIMWEDGCSIRTELYDSGSTIRECVKMEYGLALLPHDIVRHDAEEE